MSEESELEKTEDPSEKRLQQARDEGRVPHSRELSAFVSLMAAVIAFWGLGGWMFERIKILVKQGLTFPSSVLNDPKEILNVLLQLSLDALIICGPIFLILILVAFIPPFLMNSFIFSTKNLMPDFDKINPMNGLQRMFSTHSLIELGKSLVKFLVLGAICFTYIFSQKEEMINLLSEDVLSGVNHGGHVILMGMTISIITLILVVLFDVPYQYWTYYKNLKMSLEEMKQENKESAGNPQIKGRIRSLQMAASRRRMMTSVPESDVVLTNPTHYAVALSYKEGMRAPKVIAKGADEMAKKIKEVAAKSGIPIVESPPLARALYNSTKLDQDIHPGLYQAVAEILSYTYQLSAWQKLGGKYPTPPINLEVPQELSDPEADKKNS